MKHLALHWRILIAMLLGAAFGVGLNNFSGYRRFDAGKELTTKSAQPLGTQVPVQLPQGRLWVEDSPNQILIQLEETSEDRTHSRRIIVRGPVLNPVENWPAMFGIVFQLFW